MFVHVQCSHVVNGRHLLAELQMHFKNGIKKSRADKSVGDCSLVYVENMQPF